VRVWVVGNPRPFVYRSILEGFVRGFRQLGHAARLLDYAGANEPSRTDRRALPELILVVHGADYPTKRVASWKAAKVPTAVFLPDEPYEVERSRVWSKHYDWVLTPERNTLAVHAQHARAVFLPLGYDDGIFRLEGPQEKSRILVFGTCFPQREAVVRQLLPAFGADLTVLGMGWPAFGGRCHVRIGPLTPDEYAARYRGADIVLNVYRDDNYSAYGDCNPDMIRATHVNPRSWEAAACGAFQIASTRADATEFLPDLVQYQTIDELKSKLRFFLDNPEQRKAVASRVLADAARHTYKYRALELLRVLGLEQQGSVQPELTDVAADADAVSDGIVETF